MWVGHSSTHTCDEVDGSWLKLIQPKGSTMNGVGGGGDTRDGTAGLIPYAFDSSKTDQKIVKTLNGAMCSNFSPAQ